MSVDCRSTLIESKPIERDMIDMRWLKLEHNGYTITRALG